MMIRWMVLLLVVLGVRAAESNETRGLALSNARMLKPGEGYFVQNELLVSQVGIGVSPHLNVSVYSSLPFWFVPGGINGAISFKTGAKLGHDVAVAGGGLVGGASDELIWAPFGAVTWGGEDKSVTLSAAHLRNGSRTEGFNWVALSNHYRLTRGIALLGEVWWMGTPEDNLFLFAPGVRFGGGEITGDLAFVKFPDIDIPLPWVNIAYSW